MVDNINKEDSSDEAAEAPSEEVLEPTMGRGLPNYRPWDWIAGYLFAGLVALMMFGLSERMYDIAK
jgi:hypothetical protein